MTTTRPVLGSWDGRATKRVSTRTELLHGLFTLTPDTKPGLFGDTSTDHRRLVFVDENVYRLYPQIAPLLGCYGITARIVVVPGGEGAKTMDQVLSIMAEMTKFGVGRFQEVIGFGGGVLHDLLGVAAGLYRRGIPWRFFSTTLVSAIDAGFALKCAVTTDWKNRAGLYYPPVYSATDAGTFFGTLTDLDVREGYSEMLKWAVAGDGRLFDLLESDGARLCTEKFAGSDAATLKSLSLTIKGMMDELYGNAWEDNTYRKSYLGHGLSPGLEPRVTHGRAVQLEISLLAQISRERGLITETTRDRIWAAYTSVGMTLWDDVLNEPVGLFQALADTTLHRGGQQAITIPCGKPGQITYVSDLTETEIRAGLDRLREHAHLN